MSWTNGYGYTYDRHELSFFGPLWVNCIPSFLHIRLGFLPFSPVLENLILHLEGWVGVRRLVLLITSCHSSVMNEVENSYYEK